jgi:hypothetical protein
MPLLGVDTDAHRAHAASDGVKQTLGIAAHLFLHCIDECCWQSSLFHIKVVGYLGEVQKCD